MKSMNLDEGLDARQAVRDYVSAFQNRNSHDLESAYAVGVIGIAGPARSGKDYLANEIAEAVGRMGERNTEMEGATVYNIKFSNPLKLATHALFSSILSDHGEMQHYDKGSIREALQIIGTDVFREHYSEELWIAKAYNDMKRIYSKTEREYEKFVAASKDKALTKFYDPQPKTLFIVTDVRFPNEAKFINGFDHGKTFVLTGGKGADAGVEGHASENHFMDMEAVRLGVEGGPRTEGMPSTVLEENRKYRKLVLQEMFMNDWQWGTPHCTGNMWGDEEAGG